MILLKDDIMCGDPYQFCLAIYNFWSKSKQFVSFYSW